MPIAAAINGAIGLIGNHQNYNSSKNLMAKQFHYNKKMMQNAHQWEVEDLKKAGLNPVLSAGGSGAHGTGVGLPRAPDYAGSLQSAMQTYMDSKRIKNETETAKTTQQVNTATAKNQEAQAQKTNEESGTINPKANAEIKERTSNTAVNNAKVNEIKSKIELTEAQKDLTKEKTTSERGSPNNLAGVVRENVENAIDKADKDTNSAKKYKNTKKYLGGLIQIHHN